MYKALLMSILLLTFSACQKRVCPQTDTYDGLYNAMTCDYEAQTLKLEKSLLSHKLKTAKLDKEHHQIEGQIHIQEAQLQEKKEQGRNKELLFSDMKEEVEKIDVKPKIKKILESLNLQIKSMHKVLKE